MHKFTWDYFNGYVDSNNWWMVCFFRLHSTTRSEEGVFLHAIVSKDNKLHKVVKMSRSCLSLFSSKGETQRYPSRMIKLLEEVYSTNDGEIQDNEFTLTDNSWEAWGNSYRIDNGVASVHIDFQFESLLDLQYRFDGKLEYPSNTLTQIGVSDYISYQQCDVTGKMLGSNINTLGWYDHEGGSARAGIADKGWTWLSLRIGNNNFCVYETPNITEGFFNNKQVDTDIQVLNEHYSLDGYFYFPSKLQVNEYEIRAVNTNSVITSLAVLGTYFEGAVEVYDSGKLVGHGFLEFLPKPRIDAGDPRKFFESYQTYIRKEIATIYPHKLKELLPVRYYDPEISDSDINYISEPVRYMTDSICGCWRSALGMIVCQMLTDNLEALNIIKALQPYMEISQSASLMIDDIQDKSMDRRGKICAYRVYDPQICHMAGELTSFHYMNVIDSMNISGDKKFELASGIMSAIKLAHLGQVSDMRCSDNFALIHNLVSEIRNGLTGLETKSKLLKRLISINCMKTSVFVHMIFQISVLAASWYENIDESIMPIFCEVAMTLGSIYQLTNDLDDIDRKSGEDLRDNKVTIPMILATTDTDMLNLIAKIDKTPEEINVLLSHFRSNDVRGKTKTYIADIWNVSWDKLDRVTKPSIYKLQLRTFCDTLFDCK